MIALLLLAVLPVCNGLYLTGDVTGPSPGEMAHQLFLDADGNSDGVLHLSEMVNLFLGYDTNGDRRITRREYVDYTRQHEPELVNWSDTLFDIYDWDGDSILDLHDYVHFYMEMDYEADDLVQEYDFVGYWTVLFTELQMGRR